jgi:hydrogenase maturation protein HypF
MYRLVVKGIVQGVGFRPFVYRLATSMGLKGYVRNTGDGTVEILVDSRVDEFIERLKAEKPPMSVINEVRVEEAGGNQLDFQSFIILESGGRKGELSLPPPDIAICGACHSELFDPADRRYLYSFTSCTDCGQRYSVAFRLPYDRINTTFNDFPLCYDCRKEYEDVGDRRYYAQSIACPKCGPAYVLIHKAQKFEGVEAVKRAAELIDDGEFIAIKGWGGFHIACVTDDDVVEELRGLLGRPQQPFAIMARDIEAVERIAFVSGKERDELLSYIRPIVVLRKRDEKSFAAVAPQLDTIGIMLPYSPLHHILFTYLKTDYLVMTSANRPGEPMFIDDSVKDLIPTILTHNLSINRIDDSVVKVVDGERMIIRRSRGFVPNPIPVDSDIMAAAFGAELYNSIGFLKDGKAVLSQYIGDTSNFKTFHSFFKETVSFLQRFLSIENPDVVFCDMHPLYNTSRFAEKYAEEVGAELFRIQHHVAHGLSVMGEKQLDEAIAIAVDGVGYGVDGTIWGCEVLHIDLNNGIFERLGRMEHIILPGGDFAVRYPVRALIAVLSNFLDIEEIGKAVDSLNVNLKPELIVKQVRKDLNVARASSAGRYMDVASSLLNVCQERTYEGESAMKLESFARDTGIRLNAELLESRELRMFGKEGRENWEKSGTVKVIQVSEIFRNAYELLKSGENKRGVAFAFIEYLARSVAEIAKEAAEEFDAEIVMSGGVAYNSYFTPLIKKYVAPCNVHLNRLVAAGDNGISFGQLYASKMLG